MQFPTNAVLRIIRELLLLLSAWRGVCVVLAAELLNADYQAEAHLQSLDNEPLNSLSDECICLPLVGKQLSLNERPDW